MGNLLFRAKQKWDSLLTIVGLLLQTKGAILLSRAVFPTGVETGNENWTTRLTGFDETIYRSGIYWLIFGLIIQILPLIFNLFTSQAQVNRTWYSRVNKKRVQ